MSQGRVPLSQTVAGDLPCVAASEMSTQIIRGKVVPYTKYRTTSSFVREGGPDARANCVCRVNTSHLSLDLADSDQHNHKNANSPDEDPMGQFADHLCDYVSSSLSQRNARSPGGLPAGRRRNSASLFAGARQ
jgi:hypothetical protein